MKRIFFSILGVTVIVLASQVFAQEAGKMAAGSVVKNNAKEIVSTVPTAVKNENPGDVMAPQVMNQVGESTTESTSEDMKENAGSEENNDMMNETNAAEDEGAMAPEGAPSPDDTMMKQEKGSMEHMGSEGK